MFWGDSGTYDAGGYGLALVWQRRCHRSAARFTESVGRYGFYYFVGGDLLSSSGATSYLSSS